MASSQALPTVKLFTKHPRKEIRQEIVPRIRTDERGDELIWLGSIGYYLLADVLKWTAGMDVAIDAAGRNYPYGQGVYVAVDEVHAFIEAYRRAG